MLFQNMKIPHFLKKFEDTLKEMAEREMKIKIGQEIRII